MQQSKIGDVVTLSGPFNSKLEFVIVNIEGNNCTLLARDIDNYADCRLLPNIPTDFINVVDLEEKERLKIEKEKERAKNIAAVASAFR